MTRKECIDEMQRIIDEDQNKILIRVHVGYLIHAVKYLKDQPEIVRCKDCKYYPNSEGSTKWLPCRETITPPDWFCADGERKE